jgi:hypothetical protein
MNYAPANLKMVNCELYDFLTYIFVFVNKIIVFISDFPANDFLFASFIYLEFFVFN